MFCRNILRDLKILTSLTCSNKNTLIHPRYSCIFYNDNKQLHVQVPNSQHAFNYSKNQSNEFPDKLSRTLICCKYLRLIKNAVREFGPAVELNPKLAHAIENAKKNNLPPKFIEFARKISCCKYLNSDSIKDDNRANVGLYDLLLPNGCHFLIQYDDIDQTITKVHLLKLSEKFDGTLFQGETIWPKSFDQKGLILVKYKDSDPLSSMPKEALYKLGVESFLREPDVEGVDYWKVYCNPWQLHEVKQKIYEITNDVDEAFVGFLPKKKIKLAKPIRSSVFSLFHKLCEVPTIDHVYTNVDLSQ